MNRKIQPENTDFMRIILNAPHGIFVADENGKYLFVNEAACETTGYSPDELLEKNFIDMITPEDRDDAILHFSRVKTEGYASGEIRFVNKKGEIRFWLVKAVQIGDGRFVGYTTDITTEKESQLRIRERERKYRTLIDNTHDIIYTLSRDGILTYVSPSWTALLGHPVQIVTGRHFSDFLHPEDLDRCIAIIRHAVETGRQMKNVEYRIRHADGHWCWYNSNGGAVYSESGELIGIEGSASDISEHKRIEEDLKAQTQSLTVLNNIISIANQAEDLSSLTSRILVETIHSLEFESGSIYLTDLNNTRAILSDTYDRTGVLSGWISPLSTEIEPYKAIFEKNEVILDKPVRDFFLDHVPGELPPFLAGIPLVSKGQPIGLFLLATRSPQKLTRHITNSLSSIGRELGNSIERIRAREEARRSAINLETLFHSIKEMVFILNLQGEILWVNETVINRLGYKSEELLGREVLMVHDPGRQDEAVAVIEQILKGTTDICPIPVVTRDGSRIEVETLITHGWWNEQEVLIGVSRDITERRKAEKKLQDHTQFLQVLMDTLPVPVYYKNHNGTYAGCNKAFEDIVHLPREEIKGKTVFEIWPETIANQYNRADQELFQSRKTQQYEISVPDREGSIHQFIFNKACIIDSSDHITGLIGTFLDITERKNVEHALHQANQKLRLLTSITRHDIFNQVNTSELFLNLAIQRAGSEELSEFLIKAYEANHRIEEIIRFTSQYEDFGNIAGGWLTLSPIIQEAITEISPGNVTIQNFISETIAVYADPIIRKVFTSLIENAIRHGQCVTTITLSSHLKDESLIIVCEDDGIGISTGDKEQIFTHGYGKNTGIGLFITREILSITGLTIHECGIEGRGARFEILVPKGLFRIADQQPDNGGP